MPEWEDWELLEEELRCRTVTRCRTEVIMFKRFRHSCRNMILRQIHHTVKFKVKRKVEMILQQIHHQVKFEINNKIMTELRHNHHRVMMETNNNQDDARTRSSSSEDGNQQFRPSMELPTDVCSLRIKRYAWNMLPKEISERSSLQQLYLIDCTPLEIFSLPPSLKTLFTCNCRTLEFCQPKERMNLLEDLYLGRSCDSLQNFRLNYFPKLISLSMWECRNLECLSVDKELQNELTSLDALEIKYCSKLRSFLEEDEF
ncbi:hypothetical protein GQ457_07G013650 [Hibiscus cannabinus]